MEIEEIIDIFGVITLLLSNLPPKPTSKSVKSAGFFDAISKNAAVVISKNVIGSF